MSGVHTCVHDGCTRRLKVRCLYCGALIPSSVSGACSCSGISNERRTTMGDFDLLQVLDSVFKFKIGDMVNRVILLEQLEDETRDIGSLAVSGYDHKPAPLAAPQGQMVLERLLQQCHGGVQKHYLVSGDVDRHTGLVGAPARHTEIELVAREDVLAIIAKMRTLRGGGVARGKAAKEAR